MTGPLPQPPGSSASGQGLPGLRPLPRDPRSTRCHRGYASRLADCPHRAGSARHGRLDVLVASAGVQARGAIDQLSVADLRACLEVNVVGTWLACRAAVAPMRAAGYGRILTLASALGLVGAASRAGYAASKGAVLPVDGGWTCH